MPDLVFIRNQKRPDGSGFWGAYETGEDAFGVWLFTPRGSSYRGEKGGSTAYCNVGSPEGPGIPVMHLVPRAAWWIATFWAPAEVPRSLTFDISTAPHLEGAVRSYVDLELDVWVEALTGSVQLEDEDEFVAACTNGTISPPEAKAATLAADDIATLVRRRKRDLLLDPSAQGPHARRGRLTRPARGQYHRLRSRLPGDGQALRVEVHAR